MASRAIASRNSASSLCAHSIRYSPALRLETLTFQTDSMEIQLTPKRNYIDDRRAYATLRPTPPLSLFVRVPAVLADVQAIRDLVKIMYLKQQV